MASLMTIEDRRDFDPIMEQDLEIDQLIKLPNNDRKSKATAADGKT